MDQQDKLVLQPYDYVSRIAGSKMFWMKIAEAINVWTSVSETDFGIITNAINILGTASIIVDDIDDGSDLRRGQKSTHVVYGIPMALNAANYYYFVALMELQKLNKPEVLLVFAENMLILHKGQGWDIFYRDCYLWQRFDKEILNNNLNNGAVKWPTVLDYETVLAKKTSGLMTMTAELLHIASLKKNNDVKLMSHLADKIGICFQIWDDLMNILSPQYQVTNGFASDLDIGSLTYPIVLGISLLKSTPLLDNLVTRLRIKNKTRANKEEILSLLSDCGAISGTKERISQLVEEVKAMCGTLGENTLVHNFLESFSLNNL